MITNPVAARYAEACLAAFTDTPELTRLPEELRTVAHLCEASTEFQRFLGHPAIAPAVKTAVVQRVFGPRVSPMTHRVLMLLMRRRRFEILGAIAHAVETLARRQQRTETATIRSARPLSNTLTDRLRRAMERRRGTTIALTSELDPGLLGGVQVVFADALLDGSLRHWLDTLQQRLKAVKVVAR